MNQTTRAVMMAKPMEMRSDPHQGRLLKPSTAIPSFTGGKRPREQWHKRGRKEKLLLRQQAACATTNTLNSIRERRGI